MTADVVLPVPVDRTFVYSVPEELAHVVVPGSRVLVPFGKRRLTGVVVEVGEKSGDLKEIEDCLDEHPVFTSEVLNLTKWVASYYMCSWGLVLKAALPAGISYESKKTLSLGPVPRGADLDDRDRELITFLAKNGPTSLVQIERRLSWRPSLSRLNRLAGLNAIGVHDELTVPRVGVRKARHVRIVPCTSLSEVRGPKQQLVLDTVLAFAASGQSEPAVREVLVSSAASASSLNALVKKGLLEIIEKEIVRTPIGDILLEGGPPLEIELHPAQVEALEQIVDALEQKTYASFLLHGITGSGKTEVYIRALRPVVDRGQTGIVLVPEISLTPQTVTRFRAHFGDRVAVWHSRMSLGERFDTWRNLRAGRYSIVVGARSAVFAPLENIGLIVVDEEHESSYKQFDPAPRYHARDVAVYRARLNNAVCLLGSATPSLESVLNVRREKYRLLEMPGRIPLASGETAKLPDVEIVDLTLEKRKRRLRGSLSSVLIDAIDRRLQTNEQVILLQNRRGFAPVVQCQNCGWSPECRDCAVNLTYHKATQRLRCHYCGFSGAVPDLCEMCNSRELERHGVGTQRIEEELRLLFPGVRVLRMDLDTTGRKGAVHRILSKFGSGQADILLGTQMVAKGLDFARVTLVGVVNADTGLLLPDFRASERTFQLLSQVAGRAGRGDLAGDVVLQTRNPERDVIRRACAHDYEGFARQELAERKPLRYPPFGRLIFLQFRGEIEDAVAKVAQEVSVHVRSVMDPAVKILGPEPAFVARVKKLYRYQTILKIPLSVHHESIRSALAGAIASFGSTKSGVRIVVDVDPAGFW